MRGRGRERERGGGETQREESERQSTLAGAKASISDEVVVIADNADIAGASASAVATVNDVARGY